MKNKDLYLSKPWTKYYAKGVPDKIEIPDISIPELFDAAVDRFKNKNALIFYGKKIKYKKLKNLIDSLAAALADIGVKKGETVAIYLLNSPQFIISYMAVLKLGAIVTPISPVYTSHEVKHQIEDSKAKTVICEEILYDNVENAGVKLDNVILSNVSDFLPFSKRLYMKKSLSKAYGGREIRKGEYGKEIGIYLFNELIAKYPPEAPEVKIDPKKDIAALPYTGGTTGHPKAAILTHYNLISVITQMKPVFPFMEDGNETSMAFLPLFHIYGQVVIMLQGITRGFTLVLFTTPDVDEILSAIERYQASSFLGVPTFYEYLKEYDKTDRVDWKRLKVIGCGADTLHKSTIDAWERRTGTKILEGYGMTETTAVSHFSPFDRPKAGSFGVPIPEVRAAIIEVDGKKFLPINEEGELILNGPNIMQGYWKRDKETKESLIDIDGEKWLRTGDLAKMDEEGYFYFFDRKRDLIKYKGYSVFARHVEEVLYNHPKIKAAGVVGVPDPKVGSIIKAYVVLEGDARGKISEEEIMKFCKDNMAHYKVPKIIEFRGELPKTDVGKISRRELREEGDEV